MNGTGDERGTARPANGRMPSPTGFLRPLLIALGALVSVIVSFEIARRTWLPSVDLAAVAALRRVRDLLIALIAAALAAGLILRGLPSLLSDVAGSPPGSRPLTESERIAHFAEWFIRMRWIAVIIAAVLVLFAVRTVELLPHGVWWPLMATITALAVANALYSVWLGNARATAYLLPVQAYGDLVALTVLLHYSGGVENPLATLLLFHVIIAGVILPRRRCYVVAAVASVLFGVVVLAEWAHVIEHYTLTIFPHDLAAGAPMHAAHSATYALSGVTVQTAILFLTAFFTTTVTDRLRRHERQLSVYADRLHAQGQLLERALETTGTGLCVCDRQLRSTWSNTRWSTWFGQRTAGGCADPPFETSETPDSGTLDDGAVRVSEVILHEPDRGAIAERVFQVTTAPLMDTDGVATHVVRLAREITEQKRIHAGMVHAAKLAAVGELAGKVAHEVNNPIAIISAKARLLMADPRLHLPLKVTEELAKMTDLSDRVARIAQGLLSYCRPTPGPSAPFDIRIPVRKALAIIEAPAAAKDVRVVAELPDTLPEAYANAGEMEQVFLNLFLNALDAMPHGGTLSVTAKADSERRQDAKPWLEILVEDTGCGIPDDLRDHVFEPFVTTKEGERGTGLGLSICLGLVRGNGGEIDLDSEPGRGTVVQLRLPVHVGKPGRM